MLKFHSADRVEHRQNILPTRLHSTIDKY